MHRFKKHWWGMISSVILIAFTGYMLMDTFLLTKVYVGKLCTEFIFFFASWFIQSHFIFQKKEE